MNILPHIRVFKVMPGSADGRALPSGRANYRPSEQTIYLSRNATFNDVLHELGHHLIHVLGGGYLEQCRYDAATSGIPVEWLLEHGYAVRRTL